MTLPGGTGYGYNVSTHNYYDLVTGQFVKYEKVAAGLEKMMDASALNMNALTQKLIDGNISLANWQTGMMKEIKNVHVASAALSNGGWAQMTQSDWGATGQLIRQQYDYLRNYAKEIADGTQALDGRALVRSDLYADAANGTYWSMRDRGFIQDGYEEEIRDLEPEADHCEGCEKQAGHWEPIGTLDDIGDEECLTRCRCTKRYRRMTESGWEESE